MLFLVSPVSRWNLLTTKGLLCHGVPVTAVPRGSEAGDEVAAGEGETVALGVEIAVGASPWMTN